MPGTGHAQCVTCVQMKKRKKERKGERLAGFTAMCEGEKETVLEGESFVQKQRGRREKWDFSHSYFRQRLEGHLWSDLDEILVCCS
jgi:hypothetical protein